MFSETAQKTNFPYFMWDILWVTACMNHANIGKNQGFFLLASKYVFSFFFAMLTITSEVLILIKNILLSRLTASFHVFHNYDAHDSTKHAEKNLP